MLHLVFQNSFQRMIKYQLLYYCDLLRLFFFKQELVNQDDLQGIERGVRACQEKEGGTVFFLFFFF